MGIENEGVPPPVEKGGESVVDRFESLMTRPGPEPHQRLLSNIKSKLPELEKLLEENRFPWGCADSMYRFYSQSFKVYGLQRRTAEIVECLSTLAPPGATMNPFFLEIVREGASGVVWEMAHNDAWAERTRPFLEAYFHASFMLEMAVRCGREIEVAPGRMSSDWAALIALFQLWA